MDKKDYIETHFDRITQLWLSRALFFGSIIFLFVGILDYVTAYENFQLFMLYRVIIAVLLLSI
ncbi:MAG TPA: hypothetical protein ENH38_08515, partial [Nitrospirae bacterium]|nr:hypothetical protein [Nitrospirota bacterium]